MKFSGSGDDIGLVIVPWDLVDNVKMLFSTNPCPPPRSVTVAALSLVRSVSVECSSGSVVFPPPQLNLPGRKLSAAVVQDILLAVHTMEQ